LPIVTFSLIYISNLILNTSFSHVPECGLAAAPCLWLYFSFILWRARDHGKICRISGFSL